MNDTINAGDAGTAGTLNWTTWTPWTPWTWGTCGTCFDLIDLWLDVILSHRCITTYHLNQLICRTVDADANFFNFGLMFVRPIILLFRGYLLRIFKDTVALEPSQSSMPRKWTLQTKLSSLSSCFYISRESDQVSWHQTFPIQLTLGHLIIIQYTGFMVKGIKQRFDKETARTALRGQ